jgi:hypothetical protein
LQGCLGVLVSIHNKVYEMDRIVHAGIIIFNFGRPDLSVGRMRAAG